MATQDPSTNYGWNIPNVAGDSGSWGTLLNTILADDVTGIDAVVKAVSDVADAAMPKAGGVFTDQVDVHTVTYEDSNLGNMSGTQALDLAVAQVFRGTLTGNCTFSFTNVPGSNAVFVVFQITDGGAFTPTWPAAVDWPGGSAPTLTASGRDVIVFYTLDGGTTWNGVLSASDLS